MAYRKDKNLKFLKHCSNDDLDILVELLTKDKDGDSIISEELTQSSGYQNHYPNSQVLLERHCC